MYVCVYIYIYIYAYTPKASFVRRSDGQYEINHRPVRLEVGFGNKHIIWLFLSVYPN